MKWNDLTDLEKDEIIRRNQWTLDISKRYIIDNNERYYLDAEEETSADQSGKT